MASTALAAELGSRIRELRRSRGWSQLDLARRAGLASKSVISYYELGDRYPSYETLLRLADVFGVSTDFLLRGSAAHPRDDIQAETRANGDTYIRIRAGAMSDQQIDAVIKLVDNLSEHKK